MPEKIGQSIQPVRPIDKIEKLGDHPQQQRKEQSEKDNEKLVSVPTIKDRVIIGRKEK